MLSFKRFVPMALVTHRAHNAAWRGRAWRNLGAMWSRAARCALMIASIASPVALAQPALTTIQDILYRADGSRFSGTVFITWSSFLAGNGSNVATANLTLPVVNGDLQVRLVPTTTASAGAQYNITYNSNGVNEFTEVWSVPPSTLPLRVRDVRVSTGTIVGPVPVSSSPIQISDVTGLQNELAIRPLMGAGFAIGRTAVVNGAGQLDGAVGNLSDCVRVDGSSGPCGSGGGLIPSYADAETPSGAVDGVNTSFTLMYPPSPVASLALYLNGLLMEAGIDYQIAGNAITFYVGSTPQAGDLLVANYRYANPANPLGSLTSAQVVCSTSGTFTTSATLTSLGTCTLPAGLLSAGDRLEIQFQYAHAGTNNGFTGEIHVGGTTILSRSAAASEQFFAGRATFGIYSGGQQWDAESWGSALGFQAGAGAANENTAQPLTIDFRGALAAATASERVILPNFTVIRYPAQVNP